MALALCFIYPSQLYDKRNTTVRVHTCSEGRLTIQCHSFFYRKPRSDAWMHSFSRLKAVTLRLENCDRPKLRSRRSRKSYLDATSSATILVTFTIAPNDGRRVRASTKLFRGSSSLGLTTPDAARTWSAIQSSIRFASWLNGVSSASAIFHNRPTVGLIIPLSTRLI